MSVPEFTAAVLKALRESGIGGELSHVHRESRYIGPLGEEPPQIRVFRHDIQQWVELPENRIAWGPDTKAATCRTELVCRFEFGTPPGYRHYVPYLMTSQEDEWAVRISLPPVEGSIAFDPENNEVTARALHILRMSFPAASLDYVVIDKREVRCMGWEHGACSVTAVGEQARWILSGNPAEARQMSAHHDDELCCPECQRPFAIHGINCASLSHTETDFPSPGEGVPQLVNSASGSPGALGGEQPGEGDLSAAQIAGLWSESIVEAAAIQQPDIQMFARKLTALLRIRGARA